MKNSIFTEKEKKEILKRSLAFLLAVGLAFGAFPTQEVFATTPDTQTLTEGAQETTGNDTSTNTQDTSEDTTEDAAEPEEDGLMIQEGAWITPEVTGSADPTKSAPSVAEFAGGNTSSKAVDNLYVLTVSTGIQPGSTVHYFAIHYRDASNNKRTKYLFPNQDAYSISYNYLTANTKDQTNHLSNRHKILKDMGYTVNEPSSPKALTAWSVDEYLFKADYGLSGIDEVTVFMSTGSWTVQGMSISKVTSLSGYGEYGFYSGKYFFDIGKQKIVNLKKKKTGTVTLPAKGDALITLGGEDSLYFSLEQADGETSEQESASSDIYSIRLDFADQQDAGIESYLRSNGTDISLNTANLVEDLAVELEYKDTNGWTRTVTMPVVLSAVGQSLELKDDVKTYGLCQRGDTIAFSACLPEFASVASTKVYVGSAARKKLGETGGFAYSGSSSSAKTAKEAELDKDNISLAGMSIYRGTCRISNTEAGTDSISGEKLTSLTTAYSFLEANPMVYFTTTNPSGNAIYAGGSGTINLKSYKSTDPLIATSANKNFLIRLRTDSMEHAGTASDIFVKLTYTTSSGEERRTENYNAKTLVQDFMGYWPSSDGITSDFAYRYGASAASILEFPVAIDGVASITGVEVSLGSGEDDWQMTGISVDYVTGIGKRRVYLQSLSAQGSTSAFRMVRTMEHVAIPPFPLGITRHFDGNESDSWDLSTGKSTGSSGVDFESMRYSMSYDQTQMNLGFVSRKVTYDVMVTVAEDSDTANINGDSGSNNQFYFQLMFKNGNSAFVLANQQLSSDGFRSGYNETFTVSVNRNYGVLTGVRVIPEDVSEDNDIFDKLNISRITVTEQSNGGAAMQYIVDNVGWIGIDYHDSAENSSIKGREGRTVAELASRYPVSYQRHVVNLLCEVTTLPWEIEDYLQVEGSICCDLTYMNTEDQPQNISFDVVSRMAQYMNKTAISYDPPTDNEDTTSIYYKNMTTVSDPDWMLRPNHVDRFILPSIPDLKTVKSITFYATSRNNKPGQWVIGDVNISQIIEDGAVTLTADNEYYRNLRTEPLCKMTSDEGKISMLLPIGATQSIKVNFTDNELVWAEDDSWVSPVTRFPDSKEDVLNVYVYPNAQSKAVDGVSVKLAAQYTMAFSGPQQVADVMTPMASGTADARFVASGLRVAGMTNLNSITLQCASSATVFDHAIIQHIREGVIVSTYYVAFSNSSAILGLTAKPEAYTSSAEPRVQRAMISFGPATEESTLFAEQNDIAVAFKYRSSLDNGATEYYSPYVYLTDTGIGRIYPGMMAEIPFDIPYVSEITGYRIVSFGNINATVEGAAIANYSYTTKTTDESTGEAIYNDLTRKAVYTIGTIDGTGSLTPYRLSNVVLERPVTALGMIGEKALNPLDITFTTAGASSTGESGTDAAVQMTFTYLDYTGATRTKVIADAKKYIQQSGATFTTGSDARMRLFLPECSELLSIGILPYDSDGTANWTVSTVSGNLAMGDMVFNRTVDTRFTQAAEGIIYLKQVTMNTYVSVNGATAAQVTDHLKSMVVSATDSIHVDVTFVNSSGFTAKAYWIVNDQQTEVTDMISDLTATGFNVTVPPNNTNAPQTYSIVVSSSANPSVKDVINLTIQAATTSP